MTGSEATTPDPDRSGGPTAASSTTSSLIGRVLGSDFELRREIGRGGMGTVYEAWQRSLNRVVAIKVLAGSLGLSSNAVVRFQREAQAAAKLHHASIVPIYAHGDDNGLYYYAMQLVEGRSVIDIINDARGGEGAGGSGLTETKLIVGSRSGAPDGGGGSDDPDATVRVEAAPPVGARSTGAASSVSKSTIARYDEIAELIASAADGLEYAHQHGVIHRDIKPHNLIHSSEGPLCIADFGLARVLEQPGMTTTGEFIGSPLYMSPEQISGERTRVDHRTDVYSLGATLYEWTTLRPPFPGETREQVISGIVGRELTPPRDHNPTIPTDLETICIKALEKDPNRRYGSAAEMAEDLRRYVKREVIRAKREGFVSRARKLIARNRAGVLATTTVIAVLTAAYSMTVRTQRDKQSALSELQEKIITLEARNESVLETLRKGLPPSLDSKALQLGGEFLSGLTKGIAAIGEVEAGVDSTVGKPETTDRRAGLVEQDHLLVADLTEELIGRLRRAAAKRVHVATPGNPKAIVAEQYYRDALDARSRDQALSLVNQAFQNDFLHFESWYLHAMIHAQMFDVATMRDDASLLTRVKPTHAAGYIVRGMADLIEGNYGSSGVEFAQANKYDSRIPGVHIALGTIHTRTGDFEEAFDNFDRALALWPGHPAALREREQALARAGATVDDLSSLIAGDPENPDRYDAYVRRGELHALLGQFELAVADYDQALKLDPTPTASLALQRFLALTKLKEREQGRSDVGVGSPAPPAPVPPAPPITGPASGKTGATSSLRFAPRW